MKVIDGLFKSCFMNKTKIIAYKEAGKKVFGTLCNTVPEEIIHSFGVLPVRLFGLSRETENADTKLPRWLCSYARRVLEDGLKGEFKYLDGVVGAASDDTKLRLYSTFTFYVKPAFSYLIQVPFVMNWDSLNFFSAHLQDFANKLSQFLQQGFDRENFRKSVKIYNEFRSICNELNGLRVCDAPKISGVDWVKIMLSSTSMLKEDFNTIFEDRIKDLEDSEGVKDYKVRVHVSGTDFYDLELLELLERMGVVIVSDDFFTTAGYALGNVDIDNDFFKGIAERCLNCCGFATFPKASFTEDRIRFVKEMVERSRADAIIILRDRGCEIYGYQCPLIMEEFGDFPVLMLDVDAPISPERYVIRIQAFIESVVG